MATMEELSRLLTYDNKGKILAFRSILREDICYLNDELIFTEMGTEKLVAKRVRDKLIEANNLIEEFRLKEVTNGGN